MTLSHTTEYAIRTLAFIARSSETRHSCANLHKHLHISAKYLQHILTDLTKQGLIKSRRGRNGGYKLGRSSRKIYLSEIIEAVEGLKQEQACFFGFGSCPFDNLCAMHHVWARSHKALMKVFSKTRLSDLLPPSKED
jgi:Rrf2 family protein